MVYKLIRVDSEETCCKIKLAIGKHLIGRGKFLHNDDKDKRVSRNHAELEVTDDYLLLKSLHKNPCFYKKINTTGTEILQQNDTFILNTGDKFGLLPDNYWYEVLQCSDLDVAEATQNKDSNTNNNVNILYKQSNGKQDDTVFDQNIIESLINDDMNENVNSTRSPSPSLLGTEPLGQVSTEAIHEETTEATDKQSTEPIDPESTEPIDQESTETYASTPNKRNNDSLDSVPVESKRVKIEPASLNSQPGPSNDQPVSDADGVDQKPRIDPPVSPPGPARMRERCMYGPNCYRRNPEHKARFSHPTDQDWGQGARGICPYGASCKRRDPRHWLNHEHPPGVHQPQPAAGRPGRQGKRHTNRGASDSEDSDDGDSPETNLIVTGKRNRKTLNRQTWDISGSEEDEDPYKTDESDEWQPSSDLTNTGDYSQNL